MTNSIQKPEGFVGFPLPSEGYGYTQIPNELFNMLYQIESLTELKVILYIFSHLFTYIGDTKYTSSTLYIPKVPKHNNAQYL